MINDQATALRTLARSAAPIHDTDAGTHASTAAMRCLAITSGKGGVGKSNLTVNLGLELGAMGNRVAILDADFGLANADLICGIAPVYHLGHLVTGEKRLDEIKLNLARNVELIPGGAGVEELANYRLEAESELFSQLHQLERDTDFMLIDTAAGIAEGVLSVLIAAAEVIVTVTPDPTSIVDAYATIKILLRNCPDKLVWVVVNNVVGVGEGDQVFCQINSAVKNFLKREVRFLGMIPHDAQLQEAVREQVPVSQFAPSSPASRAIRLVAKQLDRQSKTSVASALQTRSFWDHLASS